MSSPRAGLSLVIAIGSARRLSMAIASSGHPSFGLDSDTLHALSILRAGSTPRGLLPPAFQPIVSAISHLAGARDAIWLGITTSVLDLASALVLFAIAGRLGVGPLWRVLVIAAFFLAPASVDAAVAGMPSSLAVLSMLLLLHAMLAPNDRRRTWMLVAWSLLAVSTSIELLVPVGIVASIALVRAPSTARISRRYALPSMVAACAVAIFVLVTWRGPPWWFPARDTVEALYFSRLPQIFGAPADALTEAFRRSLAALDALRLPLSELGSGPSSGAFVVGAALVLFFAGPVARRATMIERLRALGPISVGLLLVLATRGALGIARSRDATLARAILLLVLAVVFEAMLFELSASRRWVTELGIALGFVIMGRPFSGERVTSSAALPVYAGATITAVTSPWYSSQGSVVDLEGLTDVETRLALRRGELLGLARARGVRTMLLDQRWNDAAFFGPRYRESLRADPNNPAALLLIGDPAEKDEVLRVTDRGIDLGSLAGREFLSDGWSWSTRTSPSAQSVGEASEIVFALFGEPRPIVLELDVASVPKRAGDDQQITVWLDGVLCLERLLHPTPTTLRLAMPTAMPGRHRIRLFYTDPGPAKEPHDQADHDIFRAIEARALRVGAPPELPPRGPALGAPGGTAILASGFRGLEGSGSSAAVWAFGSSADVVFTVSDGDRDRTLVLEAGPPPPSAEGSDQIVTLRIGAVPIGSARLVPGPIAMSRFPIPRGVLVEGWNRLSLAFHRSSHDALDRALYLRSIRLE